jgi:hypothetical protein
MLMLQLMLLQASRRLLPRRSRTCGHGALAWE